MFGFFILILFTVTVTLVHGYSVCYDRIQCGEVTRAKQAFLEGNSNNCLTNDCVYTMIPSSLLVCQLKVNFTISLPQPQITPPVEFPATPPFPMPECIDAYLQIGPYKFCGNNVDQHVYIPFSASNLLYNQIRIHRAAALTAGETTWRLSVTQIECPTDQSLGHNLQNLASVQAQNLMNQQNLANLGLWNLGNSFGHFGGLNQPKNIDARLIAPYGCLQYFTEERGVIRSFNYNAGIGPYMRDMQYAICIRRPPLAKGLRLTFNTFELNSRGPTDIDGDCVESASPMLGSMDSNDYLTVPFARHAAYPESTRYCGNVLQNPSNVLEMEADAPFIIYFSSGKYYNDPPPADPVSPPPLNRAFEITYEVFK